MKNFTFFLLFLPLFSTAQIEIDNQWKNNINPIFQNLDKSKISSGMLLDYAMEFVDVRAYNGTVTDTTYIDTDVLGNIYKTLFMSKVVADTVSTPLYDRYAYNWARARYEAKENWNTTQQQSGGNPEHIFVLSGLFYEYDYLNPNALSQNKITVSNNKYYDKYINGIWQNPYQKQKVFALTPPVLYSRSQDVIFKLPDELFLSNIDAMISSIQVDIDNGQGYINIPYDTEIALHFNENKVHDLTFKLVMNNGQVYYCRSKFKIDDPNITVGQQRSAITINDELVHVWDEENGIPFFTGAWLTIRRMPGNIGTNAITRPLIIAEGLDTGNVTAPEVFGGDRTLNDFLRDLNSAGNNLRSLIDAGDFNHNYDLIYVDWVNGMADLKDNSEVLEEVLEYINDVKTEIAPGVMEPSVLLGQSMGGVIGRYTLARMEQDSQAIDHDVRLFIAHDSPMQGANTPLSVQHFAAHMKEEYVSTPLAYAFGDVILPFVVNSGLAGVVSDYINLFGLNTSVVKPFVPISDLLSLQDQKAARQLNYWSAFSTVNGQHAQTRGENLAWQQELTSMGWPANSRNIGISNGNECTVDNGFNPGDLFMTIDSRSNPEFVLDLLNLALAPLTGLITQDLGLIIVGAIPGGSRWQTNFDFNSFGPQGSQNRIYRGRIRYEKKVLWIGPKIEYDITNRSYYSPNEALPFDTYSGGTENFESFSDNIPNFLPSIDFINPEYGFIPVVSALDIKKTNGNSPTPDDFRKSYSGGVPADANLESGFDAFIVDAEPNQPFNNEHISFQPRIGDWLENELNGQPLNNNLDDCNYICGEIPEFNINGSSSICGNSSNYSVNTPANAIVTWETNNSDAVSISASGNSASISRINNFRGDVTITAAITLTGDCGSIDAGTVSKTIILGKPEMYPQGFSDPGFPPNPFFSLCQTYEWEQENWIYLFAHGSQPDSDYEFESLSGNNFHWRNLEGNLLKIRPWQTGTISFRVRASNDCGWSDWKTYTYQVTDCSGGGGDPFFAAYPNPSSDEITVSRTDDTLTNKSFSKKSSSKVKITYEIINTEGYLVGKGEILNKEKIKVSKFTPGVYVLRLISEGLVETKQIIIN